MMNHGKPKSSFDAPLEERPASSFDRPAPVVSVSYLTRQIEGGLRLAERIENEIEAHKQTITQSERRIIELERQLEDLGDEIDLLVIDRREEFYSRS